VLRTPLPISHPRRRLCARLYAPDTGYSRNVIAFLNTDRAGYLPSHVGRQAPYDPFDAFSGSAIARCTVGTIGVSRRIVAPLEKVSSDASMQRRIGLTLIFERKAGGEREREREKRHERARGTSFAEK